MHLESKISAASFPSVGLSAESRYPCLSAFRPQCNGWTILGLANSLAILTRSQAYAVVLLPLREKRFLCGAETSTNMLLYKSTLLTPAMKLSTWMPSGHSKLVLWNQWKSMEAWQHDSPSHVPHHAQSRSSSLWKMCIEMTPSKRSIY